jgi:pilus assembly protein FimV
VWLGLSGLATSVWALELGRIQVESALGEPLKAMIVISNYTPETLAQLKVVHAEAEAYQRMQLTRRPVIDALAVSLDNSGPLPVVRVTSALPLLEPHLDLLLEASWNAGRLLREYVLLIEPRRVPEVQAIVAPLVPVATDAVVANTPLETGQTHPAWPVQRGDTLLGIAQQIKAPGTSVPQRAYGLYAANSAAFIRADIHRLRLGATLHIPNADALLAVPDDIAQERLQTLLIPASAVRGRVTAAPDDAPAFASARDAVHVSRGASAQETQPSLQTIEEEVVARGQAIKEAEARIATLEKSVHALQKLVADKAGQDHSDYLTAPLAMLRIDLPMAQVLGLLALILFPALFWAGLRFERARHAWRKPASLPVVLPGLAGLNLDLAPSAGEEVANGLSLARACLTLGDHASARDALHSVLASGSAADQAEARRMLDGLDR